MLRFRIHVWRWIYNGCIVLGIRFYCICSLGLLCSRLGSLRLLESTCIRFLSFSIRPWSGIHLAGRSWVGWGCLSCHGCAFRSCCRLLPALALPLVFVSTWGTCFLASAIRKGLLPCFTCRLELGLCLGSCPVGRSPSCECLPLTSRGVTGSACTCHHCTPS